MVKMQKNQFTFALMLCLVLTACVDVRPKAPIETTDRSLSCISEKPLSKGELYAKGMQDYFKLRTHKILESHEYMNEEYNVIVGEYNRFYSQSCGILEDDDNVSHFTSKACFPYKTTKYDTFDKLKQWHKHGIEVEDYQQLISQYWQGTVIDPYHESVYKPEWYNRSADFAIVQYIGGTIKYYPKDCCQLVDFNEVNQVRELETYTYRVNEQLYKPFYFLRIKAIDIDEVRDPKKLNYLKNQKSKDFLRLLKEGDEKKHFYVALNHCGNVVSSVM